MEKLDNYQNLFSSPDDYNKSSNNKDFSHYLASSGKYKRLSSKEKSNERLKWLDKIAKELHEKFKDRNDMHEGFIFTPFNEENNYGPSLTYTNLDVESFGAATCAQICAYCRTHGLDLHPMIDAIAETCKHLWEENN